MAAHAEASAVGPSGRVPLSFWDWGPPTGEPILLIHGNPGSGRGFLRLAGALGGRFRTVAPDLPGFGSSQQRIPDYSIRAHAAQVVELMDSLGLSSAHVVGFSMGGGVAAEMIRQAPDRVRSLVLLSSIGVQEFELLGDHRLNRGIYAVQLAGIWAAVEGIPHFGLLDRVPFGYSYARNFFDSDQRPIRGILSAWSGPTLVVHGDRDRLVPVSAAREHYRIIPQSNLVLMEGDHFLAFSHPEDVAPLLARFVRRVEFGRARTRDRASGARIADAAEPLELGALPPAAGLAVVLAVLAIAAGTFISEDLTCIAAGLLVARGMLGLPQGVFACAAGIWLGDVALWALGRYGGVSLTRRSLLRWIARPEAVSRGVSWFRERGGPLIVWSRFVSGTRLPTYVAAGISGMSGWRFALWAAAAAMIWTPLLVGTAALAGQAVGPGIRLRPDQAWLTLGLVGLGLFVTVRTCMPLFTQRGRLVLRERLIRLVRLDLWPV